MKKIYMALVAIAFLSYPAISQTFNSCTGALNTSEQLNVSSGEDNQRREVHSTFASTDINCGAGKFWCVTGTNSIIEWQLSGNTITSLGTLFLNTPVISLAYCDMMNPGTISSTFYGSSGNQVSYYDGTIWK